MSVESARQAFSILNHELQARYEVGNHIQVHLEGRPSLHVMSFDPLAYETYGRFRNRGPLMSGSMILRAFLHQPHPVTAEQGGVIVYAGVEAGNEAYGFMLNPAKENHARTVNDVAKMLGQPTFKYAPISEC